MQHLVHKPLQAKQGYSHANRAGWFRTIETGVWRDAYNCLDSLGLLKGDFCSPLWVYVASLVRGVDQCLGTLLVCAPPTVHVGPDAQCAWRNLPHAMKDYILGLH